MSLRQTLILCALALLPWSPAGANITVNAGATAAQIQGLLQGTGVTIGPLTVTGDGDQWGSFANGTVNSGGAGDPFVNIDTGLILSTGDVTDAPGPNNANVSTNAPGGAPADPDLPLLQANATNDTITVEFTVVAQDDFLEFNFAFASEEYNEYVCSIYNDAMGIFVRDLGGPFSGGGVNAGVAPQSNDIISINTINNGTVGSQGSPANCLSLGNAALYKDNTGGANLVYDGLTANISKFVAVTAGVTYTVKLVLADAGDSSFDSAVFFGPINSATTHALVTEFDITAGGEVLWTTSSQIGTLAFDLQQWANGAWEAVNDLPLPADPTAPQGAHYRYRPSRALGPGPFRLLETEHGGKQRSHGPFVVPDRPSEVPARAARGAPSELLSRLPRSEPVELADRRASASRDRQAVRAGLVSRTAQSSTRHVQASSSPVVVLEAPAVGLVRVAASDLAAAFGVSLASAQQSLAAGDVRLERQGASVAWTSHAGDLVFFAEPPATNFSRGSVYLVRLVSGATMATDDGGAPAALPSPTVFTSTVVFENDAFAATAASEDPLGDFWFWEAFAAGHPSFGQRDVALELPDVVPGSVATLTVGAYGTTDPVSGDDHELEASINGQLLGRHAWSGVGETSADFAVPAGDVVAGHNDLSLTALLLPQVPASFPYLDHVVVKYQREAVATQGALELSSPVDGVVTVEGLSDSSVVVVRTSAGRAVTNLNVEPHGAGYRVSFVAQSGETYRIADATGLLSAPLQVKTPLALPDDQTVADLVVFAPPVLHAAAQQYASARSAEGIDAVVVDTEAVWLAYAHGVRDPRALRSALAEAWTTWAGPPEAALLIGHGDYDYLDRLGGGDNLLPPLLVETKGGLYSSDMILGDVSGADGVPEIVVGRLPVLSGTELLDYLGKLTSAEAPGLAGWNHVALVGDDRDVAGPFDADVGNLALLLPASTTQEQILLDAAPLAVARQQLQSAFEDGAQIVTYVGHGGLDQFAAEGLLTSSDVGALSSQGQLPVVVSLTCSVGRFEVPGFASLAETLAIDQDAGATAVWAPSGVSFNTSANLLGRFFLEAAVNPATESLGDAIREALDRYDDFGSLEELAHIYNLIGDPTLDLWTDDLVVPPSQPPSLIFSTGFEPQQPVFATAIEPRSTP